MLLNDNSLIFTLLPMFPEGQHARLHSAVQSLCSLLGKSCQQENLDVLRRNGACALGDHHIAQWILAI